MANRIPGSWKNKIVATDLLEERNNCNFDQTEALKIIWNPFQLAHLQDIESKMTKHPEL